MKLEMNRVAPLVLVAGFALSGCGGGGDNNSSNTSGTTTVTVKTDATAVMFQDSIGKWSSATSADTTAIKSYTFDVGSTTGKFGVAMVCPSFGPYPVTVDIKHFLVSEVTGDGGYYCDSTSYLHTVSGTITNIGTGNFVRVSAGQWYTSWVTGGNYSVSVPTTGTYDVVALEETSSGVPVRAVIVRDVAVSSATTSLPSIDMNTGVSVTPRTLSVTATGTITAQVNLHTKNGTGTTLSNTSSPSSTTWYELNGGTIAGDSYSIFASNGPVGRSISTNANTTVGNIAVDLTSIAPMSGATLSTGSHPAIGASYAKAATSPALYGYYASLTQSGVQYRILASPAWSGSNLNYTIPDFTGLANWNSAWNLATGVNTSYSIGAQMTDLQPNSTFEFSVQNGTTTL